MKSLAISEYFIFTIRSLLHLRQWLSCSNLFFARLTIFFPFRVCAAFSITCFCLLVSPPVILEVFPASTYCTCQHGWCCLLLPQVQSVVSVSASMVMVARCSPFALPNKKLYEEGAAVNVFLWFKRL